MIHLAMFSFAALREGFILWQPFVVVLTGIVSFITGCITFWLLIRTRPRKLHYMTLEPDSVIVNWSGHPLPDAPWAVPFRIWTPETPPHFNTESWESVQVCAQRLIRNLPNDIQVRLLKGDTNVILVVPQLAAGLALLLTVLHGKTGVFPTITCPLRKADGSFILPVPVNLGEIRLRARQEETERGE